MIQFADVSAYQENINWGLYPYDIVAIKVSEGVGLVDPFFSQHQAGALARGVSQIWYYHFARSDLNNIPSVEWSFFRNTLGTIRPQDRVVLDYEVRFGSNAGVNSDNEWALKWLTLQGPETILYSYLDFIQNYLQDSRLNSYDLWLADYVPNRVSPPYPWSNLLAQQYTPDGFVPGISGQVDLNYFYGEFSMLYTSQSADFATYFVENSLTNWTCKHTGAQIFDSNLLAYQKMSVDGQTIPIIGLALANETYVVVNGKSVSFQPYERGLMIYDPSHVIDSQPGLGASYLLHWQQVFSIPQLAQLLPGIPTKIPDVIVSDIRQLIKDAGV
jgi:GH25 family lysozyme M1 (1,4-beta-N-acetylmuramidase)